MIRVVLDPNALVSAVRAGRGIGGNSRRLAEWPISGVRVRVFID